MCVDAGQGQDEGLGQDDTEDEEDERPPTTRRKSSLAVGAGAGARGGAADGDICVANMRRVCC
jgi:hypothetical protein